jgi:hypothetical protein
MQDAANQAKCVERRFESELPECHYPIATNVPGRVLEFDTATNSGDRRGEAFRWPQWQTTRKIESANYIGPHSMLGKCH